MLVSISPYQQGSHPWGYTITPASANGYSSISTITNQTFGTVSAVLMLEVGVKYTFKIFRISGSYTVGDGGFNMTSQVVNANGTLGGSPDWIPAADNTSTIYNSSGTYIDINAVHYAFTPRPAITANIIDTALETPVISYIAADAAPSNSRLPIKVDATLWCGKSANITSIFCSARGSTDTLTPNKGTTNATPSFSSTFSTYKAAPDIIIGAQQINIGYYYSDQIHLVPAKHLLPFHCTIYFTPKQDTFDSNHGFSSDTVDAVCYQTGFATQTYNKDFLRYVRKEGNGKLTAPYNGKEYIHWAYESRSYEYYVHPIGQKDTPLDDKVSCAVPSGKFPFGTQILTLSPDIKKAFGAQHQNRTVIDTGTDLKSNQIDLYWKDADPKPLSGPTDKASLFRPADMTTFTEANNVPVYLLSY